MAEKVENCLSSRLSFKRGSGQFSWRKGRREGKEARAHRKLSFPFFNLPGSDSASLRCEMKGGYLVRSKVPTEDEIRKERSRG